MIRSRERAIQSVDIAIAAATVAEAAKVAISAPTTINRQQPREAIHFGP
jgi:hypothetical protein